MRRDQDYQQSLVNDDVGSSTRYRSADVDEEDDEPKANRVTMLTRFVIIALLVGLIAAGVVIYLILQSDDSSNSSTPPPSPYPQLLSIEQQYRSFLQTTETSAAIGSNLYNLTSHTHRAGTPGDQKTAQYVADHMRAAGIPQVEIDSYYVLLSSPVTRSLSMTQPSISHAILKESNYTDDPTSFTNDVPTFNGYSGNCSLIGVPLVYARYCHQEDFQYLLNLNVNVSGHVVLCRYGEGWRGDKVDMAVLYGGIAVLLYSDPADDGFTQGQVYTAGPWKPQSGVQRGSIWDGSGDPLTPSWSSRSPSDTGYRITVDEARSASTLLNNHTPLPTVCSLPISWGDAAPLMGNLTGLAAPANWTGAIPNITYHLGGTSDVLIDLTVVMDLNITEIWNVIGTIPGEQEPESQVIIGNHRDAWVYGSIDPSSGTITLLQTVAALGQLYQTLNTDGSRVWIPRRTIKLCSWDGEEYGLVGSTEHLDTYETDLLLNGIVYINIDEGVAGFDQLEIIGQPALSAVIANLTKDINLTDPQTHKTTTLYDLYLASNPPTDPAFDFPLLSSIGGTGSDYGGFVQRLGILSIDLTIDSFDGMYSGVYHSEYDSIYWTTHFGDGSKNYTYTAALAQLWGSIVLRFANSLLLPIQVKPFTAILNNLYQSVKADALHTFPQLTSDFTSLQSSISNLATIAQIFDSSISTLEANLLQNTSSVSPNIIRVINQVLSHMERYCLYLPGIPNREWFRNVIWLTSIADGYSGDGFALIADNVAANDFIGTKRAVWSIIQSLQNLAYTINSIQLQLNNSNSNI